MGKEFKRYPEIGRVYDHYKGGKYQVLTLAKHSETDEDEVVYRSLIFGSVYTRPLRMWFEEVENHEGKKVSRFSLSSDVTEQQSELFFSAKLIEKLRKVDQRFIDQNWLKNYEVSVLISEVIQTLIGL